MIKISEYVEDVLLYFAVELLHDAQKEKQLEGKRALSSAKL
jgi:hypothetical protein